MLPQELIDLILTHLNLVQVRQVACVNRFYLAQITQYFRHVATRLVTYDPYFQRLPIDKVTRYLASACVNFYPSSKVIETELEARRCFEEVIDEECKRKEIERTFRNTYLECLSECVDIPKLLLFHCFKVCIWAGTCLYGEDEIRSNVRGITCGFDNKVIILDDAYKNYRKISGMYGLTHEGKLELINRKASYVQDDSLLLDLSLLPPILDFHASEFFRNGFLTNLPTSVYLLVYIDINHVANVYYNSVLVDEIDDAYEVFSYGIFVFVRTGDGSVYFINNQTRQLILQDVHVMYARYGNETAVELILISTNDIHILHIDGGRFEFSSHPRLCDIFAVEAGIYKIE